MNHLDAYKLLRKNGFHVSVSTGRQEEPGFTVTAFNRTADLLHATGITARVQTDSIENGIVEAAKRVNESVLVLKACSAHVGEDDFAGWAFL